MGRNNYFKFKQFTIQQEQAAMKVGTDGVLLGSWAETDNCKRILDIGTGTGVIALMMAQRSEALIDAIEIEEGAAREAQFNVDNSPWCERISVHHSSFQKHVETTSNKYNLIISNPPFFSNSRKNNNHQRSIARHNDSLPFADLISGTKKLLSKDGFLAVILPNDTAEIFENMAISEGFILKRKTLIRPHQNKNTNRVLLEFGQTVTAPVVSELTIYDEERNYTPSYKELTRAFYLKF